MHLLILILGLSFSSFSSAQLLEPESKQEDQTVQINGFDCANEVLDVLPVLGRGNQFPLFLLRDIQTELERQHSQSKLLAATCQNPPEMLGATTQDAEQQLTKLNITFDLLIKVDTGVGVQELDIKHAYFAENLQTEGQQKVTQRFIVQ